MRRLVLLVLILAVLFVVVDRVAASLAARAVAENAQKSQGLAARPSVTIGGFPFLTQAVRGGYDDVHVSIHDLAATSAVTIQDADLTLQGVHLGLSDALHRRVTRVPVDSAEVTASLPYSVLDSAVAARLPSQLSASFAYASPDSVRASLRWTGVGGPLTAGGVAAVSLVGTSIHLQLLPDTLGSAVLAPLRTTLAGLLRLDLTLPRLPFGARILAARASESAVTVTASATRLVLGQDDFPGGG